MRWLLVTRVQRLWRPLRRLGHARAGLLAAPSLLLLVSVARQPRVSVRPPAAPFLPSPVARLPHVSVRPLAAPSLLLLVSVARQLHVSVGPLAGPSQPSLASAAQPLPASVELLAPSLSSASPPYPAPCACRTRSGRVLFG